MSNVTNVNEAATRLESAIESWRKIFAGLSEEAVRFRPEPSRWSIAEVVGHLVDSACNNHQRFVRAQFSDEFIFPRYEQNEWVSAGNYQQADWESLVQLWYHYNRQIAVVFRNISDEQLSTPCTITPSEPCTLGFLVTDYVDHLIHHCKKIDERVRGS